MSINSIALRMLAEEAGALLVRLSSMKPLALHDTSVPAAAISRPALTKIEAHLARGRERLRQQLRNHIRWIETHHQSLSPATAQRRYTLLRLRFNAVLSQFDIFSDVLTQRSEHDIGIWLSGLDAVAADALNLPGYYEAPAVICYLDRGGGAAIRRARTRLPGGGQNPVAVIRVPRERMVGSGIASSLIHEVGHQAAALLDLVDSVRPALRDAQQRSGDARSWQLWERWISEVLADLWSVGTIGVASTLGLMGVVSLPRAFVFRVGMDDPHPIPWIRVKLSCYLGQALYPHPQWTRLARVWESLYPIHGLAPAKRTLLREVEDSIPAFVQLLLQHRPLLLRGRSVKEVLGVQQRQPRRLSDQFLQWRRSAKGLYRASPALAFAVLGQARLEGKITPQAESALLTRLLTHWALRGALNLSVSPGRSSWPSAALST